METKYMQLHRVILFSNIYVYREVHFRISLFYAAVYVIKFLG